MSKYSAHQNIYSGSILIFFTDGTAYRVDLKFFLNNNLKRIKRLSGSAAP